MPNPINALAALQKATNFSNAYGLHQVGPIGQWLQKLSTSYRDFVNSGGVAARVRNTPTTKKSTNKTSNWRPGTTILKEVIVTAPKKQTTQSFGLKPRTITKQLTTPRTDWNKKFQDELASWSNDDIKKIDALGFDFTDAQNLQNSINVYLANNPQLGISPLTLDNYWGNKSKTALRTILSSIPVPQQMPNTQQEEYYEPINDYWTYYAKQGGQLNKFQKGGSMNDKQIQKAFIQFLAQKSGAKTQKELEQYILLIGEDGLKQAYQEFTEFMQKQAVKAKHGAKLNYIKRISHKCADDEELYYFKRGGSVGCGCKKKEGGEIVKNQKGNSIDKFKNRKKQIAEEDTIHTKSGIRDLAGKTNYPKFDPKKATKEERRRASDKDYMAGRSAKQGAKLNKNCGGSKMKLEKGDKVKSAGAGCIAKFKMHRLGGSLNGVPFMLKGKNLPTAPKVENRYKKGRITWNTPEYKEVSSASNVFGDPFASKIAMEVSNNGNDTTFYETPGRWLPVKFKTRTASKKNQNFQNISYYLGLPTNETKTIIISPEYEILKRRFNTAWNLAK